MGNCTELLDIPSGVLNFPLVLKHFESFQFEGGGEFVGYTALVSALHNIFPAEES